MVPLKPTQENILTIPDNHRHHLYDKTIMRDSVNLIKWISSKIQYEPVGFGLKTAYKWMWIIISLFS